MWRILLKINSILVPIITIWGVWATFSILDIKDWIPADPLFTSINADELNKIATENIKDWTVLNFAGQSETNREAILFNAENIKTLQEELVIMRKEDIALQNKIAEELVAIRVQLIVIEKLFSPKIGD